MRKPPPYLLIVIARLVVVVGLQGQLGVTLRTPEAAAVEEGVVLEGADLVGGVDRLVAAQAVAVHVVCLEHGGGGGAGGPSERGRHAGGLQGRSYGR